MILHIRVINKLYTLTKLIIAGGGVGGGKWWLGGGGGGGIGCKSQVAYIIYICNASSKQLAKALALNK